MGNRLEKIRGRLTEKGIDALLVSQSNNRRYLSGFISTAGFLIISQKQAVLATDFRYIEQAKKQSPNFEIVQVQGKIATWLPKIVVELGLRNIGFEADDVSFNTYNQLARALNRNREKIPLIPTERIIESIRSIKDKDELKLITKAVELADAAFEQVAPTIRKGMTEKEVAWQIEKTLRDNGSENIPFEVIVASGPRSALPHAKPTERSLLPNEPIVIDMGAQIGGYCSDLSRTITVGNNSDTMFTQIYETVYRAQSAAIAGIRAGISAKQADGLARTVIEQYGYGAAFGHSLGHGIGLAPHESPFVGPTSEDILSNGMVFTIEPGIYLKEWGGVRIEDTAVIENGKVRILSKARKFKPQGEISG